MSSRSSRIIQGIVKVLWLYVVLSSICFSILALPIQYQELMQVCVGNGCVERQLNLETAAALQEIGVSLEFRSGFIIAFQIIGFLMFLILAAFLFWLRSNDLFALFLGLTFVSFQAGSASNALQSFLPDWFSPFIYLSEIGTIAFPIIFYLFPDGRFVPRWTRYVITGWVLIGILLTFVPMPELQTRFEVVQIFWVALFMGSMLAQIYRYRYISTQLQRHQTKWIVYGLIMSLSVLIPWILIAQYIEAFGDASKIAVVDILDYLVSLYFSAVISLSFGIAILRYKLWDIDLVIRRTLIYGVLTGALALVYYFTVIIMQRILPAESPIAIVFSTLSVAALFSPLRHRIQDMIDKRFYRRRYDAEQAIARFTTSIRDEVELDRIANSLISTVDETMHPEHISLWLRPE